MASLPSWFQDEQVQMGMLGPHTIQQANWKARRWRVGSPHACQRLEIVIDAREDDAGRQGKAVGNLGTESGIGRTRVQHEPSLVEHRLEVLAPATLGGRSPSTILATREQLGLHAQTCDVEGAQATASTTPGSPPETVQRVVDGTRDRKSLTRVEAELEQPPRWEDPRAEPGQKGEDDGGCGK